jgi:hypothetical protein
MNSARRRPYCLKFGKPNWLFDIGLALRSEIPRYFSGVIESVREMGFHPHHSKCRMTQEIVEKDIQTGVL